MKLAHLVKQIRSAAPNGILTDQMIYASLDFDGPRNGHLAIPDWHDHEHSKPDMRRFEFLTGEEEITGDFLVFRYSSHDGTMYLREYASFQEAADCVLGGGGVFSPWTDLVLVFDHLRIRPYRASYQGKSGARVPFDRWEYKSDDGPITDPQIEWLEAGTEPFAPAPFD
jgi:hypothetical protein